MVLFFILNEVAGSVMVSCRIVVPVTRVRFPASEIFFLFCRIELLQNSKSSSFIFHLFIEIYINCLFFFFILIHYFCLYSITDSFFILKIFMNYYFKYIRYFFLQMIIYYFPLFVPSLSRFSLTSLFSRHVI